MADNNEQNTQPSTLEEYIAQHQQQWSNVISEMNGMMKKFSDLPDLQMTIYSKRQNALDYYFNLLYQISSMSKEYKKQYAAKYNSYKVNSQIRYNSDTAINAQIAVKAIVNNQKVMEYAFLEDISLSKYNPVPKIDITIAAK